MITEKEQKCIYDASFDYKDMVSQVGPDGHSGFNDKWEASVFYDTIYDNIDEFRDEILNHPFFVGKGYKTLDQVYEKDHALFMYCLQVFFNEKMYGSIVSTELPYGAIEVDPDTMEPISAEISEDKENKKEFLKEVMEGVEKKKSLKDFLTDPRSYKQFRDDVENVMMNMDWDKIHRAMKNLKWKWVGWTDFEGNEHYNTTPSAYGLKKEVLHWIHDMEDWIMKHGDSTHYLSGTGGFEYEMWTCDKGYEDSITDDYNNRVRFVVRFVLDQYDNGM